MSDANARIQQLCAKEWRVTNRLGGYASSTAAGMNTRRGHGLLVAPFARGAQRLVLLSRVEETLKPAAGPRAELACNQYPGTIFPRGDQHLGEFDCERSPRWLYTGDGWALEKRLHLLEDQNTVVLVYRLLEAKRPVELTTRLLFALRPQRELMYQWNGRLNAKKCTKLDWQLPATNRTPEVFWSIDGSFDSKAFWYYNTIYASASEGERGGLEDLWSPGQVRWTLAPGAAGHIACSTGPVRLREALESLKRPAERAVAARVDQLVLEAAKPDAPRHRPVAPAQAAPGAAKLNEMLQGKLTPDARGARAESADPAATAVAN